MKNLSAVILMVSLLLGCGGATPKEESSSQGKPEKRDYVAMGFQYLEKSELPKALQSFDLAIKQNPRDVKNYFVLGEVYMRLKNFTSAEDTFIGATKAAPANEEAYYYLALSRAAQAGKKDLAIVAIKKSAELAMQSKNEANFKRAVTLLKTIEAPQQKAVQTQ